MLLSWMLWMALRIFVAEEIHHRLDRKDHPYPIACSSSISSWMEQTLAG